MRRLLALSFTVLYPLGFAFAPILSLYANNAATFHLGVIVVPLFSATVGTALLLVVATLRMGEVRKAAVITSYFAILFFSHGHFQSFAVNLGVPAWLAGWLLLVLGLALAVVGIFGVSRATNLNLLTRILSIASLAMVILPVAAIATFDAATRQRTQSTLDSLQVDLQRAGIVSSADFPDIYYIVLGGYGRQDALLKHFGHDNEPFLEFLESRGFHVVRDARANYGQTALSMSSVFNMDFVQNLVRIRPQHSDLGPLRERIRENRVAASLRKLGYTIVTFSSATDIVSMQRPDIHFQGQALDAFRVGVLDLTPIGLLASRVRSTSSLPLEPYRAHHANVRFKFEQLRDLSEYSRPFFVYAHFLCPQPPFVFEDDGTFRDPRRTYTIREHDWTEGYAEGYRAQLEFVNERLRGTIDAILERSPRRAVIVLQSDHGPASAWLEFWRRNRHWTTQEPEIVRERLGVLNAIRLPEDARERQGSEPASGRATAAPSEGMSLVNTFRIVMNACFGMRYELLPDDSYFSSYDAPYAFFEANDIMNAAPAPAGGGDADESLQSGN